MSNATFTAAYDRISNEVVFNPSWKNGTGYLDNAVHDLQITEICKTVDNAHRKIIVIPTAIGNVVVFERFTDGDRGIIVSNAPRAIERLAFGMDLGSSLGDAALAFYLGDEWGVPAIGERIDDLLNLSAKAK